MLAGGCTRTDLIALDPLSQRFPHAAHLRRDGLNRSSKKRPVLGAIFTSQALSARPRISGENAFGLFIAVFSEFGGLLSPQLRFGANFNTLHEQNPQNERTFFAMRRGRGSII